MAKGNAAHLLCLVGWTTLALLAVRQLWLVLRDRRHLVSPNAIVSIGFVFLYVVSWLAIEPARKDSLISESGYLLLLLLALTACSAFNAGFALGGSWAAADRGEQTASLPSVWPIILLAAIAFVCWFAFLERSGGFVHYYGHVHGGGGAWSVSSAYLYRPKLFLFACLYVLFYLFLTRTAAPLAIAAMLSILAFLVFDSWVAGSRGGWLSLMLTIAVPALLLRHARPGWRRAARVAVPCTLALVLLTPYIRSATHLQSGWQELERALIAAVSKESPLSGGGNANNNEVVVAAAVVQAAHERGVYDAGMAWAYPFVNFVPRFVWTDKPYRHEWSIDTHDLVFQAHGWKVTSGAAITGLASTFVRFGWFSPLVWLVFGALGGVLFVIAARSQSWNAIGHLTGANIFLVYFVTQGFFAAVIHALFFLAPLWLVAICGQRRFGPRGNVAR